MFGITVDQILFGERNQLDVAFSGLDSPAVAATYRVSKSSKVLSVSDQWVSLSPSSHLPYVFGWILSVQLSVYLVRNVSPHFVNLNLFLQHALLYLRKLRWKFANCMDEVEDCNDWPKSSRASRSLAWRNGRRGALTADKGIRGENEWKNSY